MPFRKTNPPRTVFRRTISEKLWRLPSKRSASKRKLLNRLVNKASKEKVKVKAKVREKASKEKVKVRAKVRAKVKAKGHPLNPVLR